MDDYISETVSCKLSPDVMIHRMNQPAFEVCETEAQCDEVNERCQDWDIANQTLLNGICGCGVGV